MQRRLPQFSSTLIWDHKADVNARDDDNNTPGAEMHKRGGWGGGGGGGVGLQSPQASCSPVKAFHPSEVVLTGLGERRLASAPMEPIDVHDGGSCQLHSEVSGAASLLAPLETRLVIWPLRFRAGKLSMPVPSQTLICTFTTRGILL